MWVDQMDNYEPYYGDDASIFLLWILIWVGVCFGIAYIFRIKDGDDERSKKIFDSIIHASIWGAIHGFCLFILALLVIGAMSIVGVPVEWLFDLVGIGGMAVFFFALVNVTGINYILKEGEHVIVRTESMEISHRHDDDDNDEHYQHKKSGSWLEMLKKSSK